MPTVRLFTNVARKDVPQGFMDGFQSALAQLFQRDAKHITLHVLTDQLLQRGVDGGPFCYTEVFNTGGHGNHDEIRQKVVAISAYLKEALRITNDEMIQVWFHVIPPHHLGIGSGKLLADLRK